MTDAAPSTNGWFNGIGTDRRLRRLELCGHGELAKKEFNLVLSMAACFVAVEVGALVVCMGIMLLDSGPLAILEGIAVWAFAQPVILLIALFSMPIGALLRMILGLTFEQPRPVALLSGAFIGVGGALLIAFSIKDGWSALPPILFIGLVAGIVGGWTWWRVEKSFLDRQKMPSTP